MCFDVEDDGALEPGEFDIVACAILCGAHSRNLVELYSSVTGLHYINVKTTRANRSGDGLVKLFNFVP